MHENSFDQSEIATTSSVLYPNQSQTVLPREKKLSSFWTMVKKSAFLIGWYGKNELGEQTLDSDKQCPAVNVNIRLPAERARDKNHPLRAWNKRMPNWRFSSKRLSWATSVPPIHRVSTWPKINFQNFVIVRVSTRPKKNFQNSLKLGSQTASKKISKIFHR